MPEFSIPQLLIKELWFLYGSFRTKCTVKTPRPPILFKFCGSPFGPLYGSHAYSVTKKYFIYRTKDLIFFYLINFLILQKDFVWLIFLFS